MFDNIGCDVSDIFVWPDVLSDRVEFVHGKVSVFVWGEHSRPCHCIA